MKIRFGLTGVAVAVAAVLGLAGCSSSRGSSSVPSLRVSGAAASSSHGGYSAGRVAALRAAAQCIRTHGVPTYQDPVLTADGQVYTDARSIQDIAGTSASRADVDRAMAALNQACGPLMAAAGFQPQDEAPAPPNLVQAGVTLARCLRANGLPNYRDPSSSSPFTPGHGFGISGDELPNNGAGGKQDPTFQRAFTACKVLNDAEITASTLSSLAHE